MLVSGEVWGGGMEWKVEEVEYQLRFWTSDLHSFGIAGRDLRRWSIVVRIPWFVKRESSSSLSKGEGEWGKSILCILCIFVCCLCVCYLPITMRSLFLRGNGLRVTDDSWLEVQFTLTSPSS